MLDNIEALKKVFYGLYDTNLEAADEEYLENYTTIYDPTYMRNCYSPEDVVNAIKGLANELIEDTGEKALIREWLHNAGASAELIAACGL